jgi:predicted nucleic-acid-binding Zn-ribbon protein
MGRTCPKCGSANVTEFTGKFSPKSEVFADTCKNCGYEGYMTEENKK